MSDAPERIWIEHPLPEDQPGVWFGLPSKFMGDVEYIRADVTQADLDAAVAAALEEAARIMPRYHGIWSATGVHVGVWEDGPIAAKILSEYSGGVARDMVDVKDIRALSPTGALDRVRAEARREALEEAVKRAQAFAASCFDDDDDEAGSVATAVAAAIRAKIDGEGE